MMSYDELIKKMSASEEFFFTNRLQATYFVLENGKKCSFGYDYGARSSDHRTIFGCFDNIERNDWEKLFEETRMIGYIPELNEVFYLKNQNLTKQQKNFIKRYECQVDLL